MQDGRMTWVESICRMGCNKMIAFRPALSYLDIKRKYISRASLLRQILILTGSRRSLVYFYIRIFFFRSFLLDIIVPRKAERKRRTKENSW